jgi:hypothetical protein
VLFFRGCGRIGVCGFELGVAGLAVVDVAEEVEVVVQEICCMLALVIGVGVELDLQSWVTLTRRLTRGWASFSISSGVSPRICTWRLVVSASRCWYGSWRDSAAAAGAVPKSLGRRAGFGGVFSLFALRVGLEGAWWMTLSLKSSPFPENMGWL